MPTLEISAAKIPYNVFGDDKSNQSPIELIRDSTTDSTLRPCRCEELLFLAEAVSSSQRHG